MVTLGKQTRALCLCLAMRYLQYRQFARASALLRLLCVDQNVDMRIRGLLAISDLSRGAGTDFNEADLPKVPEPFRTYLGNRMRIARQVRSQRGAISLTLP